MHIYYCSEAYIVGNKTLENEVALEAVK